MYMTAGTRLTLPIELWQALLQYRYRVFVEKPDCEDKPPLPKRLGYNVRHLLLNSAASAFQPTYLYKGHAPYVKQVIVISGHPDLSVSRVNTALMSEISHRGVKVHSLARAVTPTGLDIRAEQAQIALRQ